MKAPKSVFWSVALVCLSLSAVSASAELSPAPSAPAPESTPSASVPDPLAAPADMLSLRDPFRRPILGVENERPRTELETFPADQLRMIGVLTGPKKLKGMILAPNGKTYFVTLNTAVGMRSGVVTQITESSIQIREKVVNVLGQQEDLDTLLTLASDRRFNLVTPDSMQSDRGASAANGASGKESQH